MTRRCCLREWRSSFLFEIFQKITVQQKPSESDFWLSDHFWSSFSQSVSSEAKSRAKGSRKRIKQNIQAKGLSKRYKQTDQANSSNFKVKRHDLSLEHQWKHFRIQSMQSLHCSAYYAPNSCLKFRVLTDASGCILYWVALQRLWRPKRPNVSNCSEVTFLGSFFFFESKSDFGLTIGPERKFAIFRI